MNRAASRTHSRSEQTSKPSSVSSSTLVVSSSAARCSSCWSTPGTSSLHSVQRYIAMAIAMPLVFALTVAGLALSLGRHHRGGRIHALRHRRDPDPSPLSRAAKTRSGLQSRHSPGPGEVSHPHHRSRPRTGSSLAARPHLEALEDRHSSPASSSSPSCSSSSGHSPASS